jgi:hypothetical protein
VREFHLSVDLCTLFTTQAGAAVEILFGILGYFSIVGLIIRFVQVTRQRDVEMRRITDDWIQETKGGHAPA